MTSRRNFDRKRLTDRLLAERSTDPQDILPEGSPRRDKPPLRGCRDRWDGPPFPVTVTQRGALGTADQASKAQAA